MLLLFRDGDLLLFSCSLDCIGVGVVGFAADVVCVGVAGSSFRIKLFLEFFFLSLGMAECEAKNDEPLKVLAAVFNEFETAKFDIFFFCSIEPPPIRLVFE